ncbi:sigma-70 family RNA polymerase sigma factor [Bradyrhizobium guangzhouense]
MSPVGKESAAAMSNDMTRPHPTTAAATSPRGSHTFEQLAEPFRRGLKLHCYRMMGSISEAEDLVQETYLRAWRNFDRFEERGSFRAWLFRIATNVCLDALASRTQQRRFLPDRRFPPDDRMPDGIPADEVAWIDPYPDSELEGVLDGTPNPEARYAAREAVQLAFVAAIQQLPPRQRAALLLCDVLGWKVSEVATLLGGSTTSINSALQRARTTTERGRRQETVAGAEPDAAQKILLGRYVKAWEALDLDGFVALLKEDATYTMPPMSQWYAGRQSIRAFFKWAWKDYEGYRLLTTAANGQPAFAAYARAGEEWRAHSIQVLSLGHESVSSLTLFVRPSSPRLFSAFGLPVTLEG